MMENSRTPINSSEKAALDHLEQYLDTAGDDETLTREDPSRISWSRGVSGPMREDTSSNCS